MILSISYVNQYHRSIQDIFNLKKLIIYIKTSFFLKNKKDI